MKYFNDKSISKKGFTLVEVIVVLVILAILAAIAIPSLVGYIDNSKAKVCKVNRSSLQRYFIYTKTFNPDATLDKMMAGKYDESSADMDGLVCPSGGVFSLNKDGTTIDCSIHSGNDSNESFFPGTDIPLFSLGDVWPKDEDYDSNGNYAFRGASGIFKYGDDYYVITASDAPISFRKDQLQSGPGGTIYEYGYSQKLTGKFIDFSQSGTASNVKRGDMAKVGNDYYVFNSYDDNGHNATTPGGSNSQWCKIKTD